MRDTIKRHSERVGLHMTPTARHTLQRAAAASNKTLSKFVLDASLNVAHDAQSDRRMFLLDTRHWNEFMAALDAPPRQNPRLRKLLARKPGWGS